MNLINRYWGWRLRRATKAAEYRRFVMELLERLEQPEADHKEEKRP